MTMAMFTAGYMMIMNKWIPIRRVRNNINFSNTLHSSNWYREGNPVSEMFFITSQKPQTYHSFN
jgi:hypothetical protein